MSEADELERLFFLLLDADADERADILARESISPKRQQKLERMLALDKAQTDGALRPSLDPMLTPEFEPGVRFDGFEIVEHIAGGGMGDVYLARQENPTREVALKVIKQGMANEQVVARFNAELQALARMQHAAVARIFGAGTTPRGRPYFTMEFVRGAPISDYCNSRQLNIRERVKIFLQVCEGVQHAHQNAILHRDLKPSNVLVTELGEDALPKIIDFGVSKATGDELSEQHLQTEYGILIGTPEYMSPEQADLAGSMVDTRTDVYSLGVMLYQLLTGTLPFSSEELRGSGYDSIQRIIRERVPTRPSTKVGTDASDHSPGGGSVSLYRELSGDLDWIVMKALEKEPHRRYGSPADLAADLRRYLADEPVLAGPPSTTYRARKFVKRHTLGVFLASISLVILLVFAVTMSFQAQRIADERDRADQAAAVAREEAVTAQRVSELMLDLFAGSNPSYARGEALTVREVLDAGAERILTDLDDEPAIQAQLLATIGDSYRALGLWTKSIETLEAALGIFIATFGEESAETANAKVLLSYPLIHEAQFERAERLNREALATMRRVLPDGDPEIAKPIIRLAFNSWRSYAEVDEMVPLLEEALAVLRNHYGDVHLDLAAALDQLGMVHGRLGNEPEAESAFLEAMQITDELFDGVHPRAGYLLTHYLNLLIWQGRLEEALTPARDNLSLMLELYGERHPEVGYAKRVLADILWRIGRVDEATILGREAMELIGEFTGRDDTEYANTVAFYALTLVAGGSLEEAAQRYLETEHIFQAVLGERHPAVANMLRSRAEVAHYAGNSAIAESLLNDALEIREGTPPDSEGDAGDRAILAMVLMDQGSVERACSQARASMEGFKGTGSEGRELMSLALTVLGRCHAIAGELERAEELLREGLKGLEVWYPDSHPTMQSVRRYVDGG